MKHFRKLSWYSLPLWLVFVLVPSADAKNNLTCTMVDETGKPVAKQEFILATTGTEKSKETKKKTNDAGVAEFKNLDDGTYELRGVIQGYVAIKSNPIALSGNANQTCNYTVVTAQYANNKLQEVMQLIRERKVPQAEVEAKKAVEVMPNEAAAHYVLGVVYAYQGKDEALAEVNKAGELMPAQFKDKVLPIQMQMLNVQADLDKQKRDYAGAIGKYNKLMEIAPNDPVVLYNMAVTYAAAKDLTKALANIEKVLILKPDDADAKKLRDAWDKQFSDQLNQELKK